MYIPSGLQRQMAEGVVRGVDYRPRQRVLLATIVCLVFNDTFRHIGCIVQ